jgi:hypothetical protein
MEGDRKEPRKAKRPEATNRARSTSSSRGTSGKKSRLPPEPMSRATRAAIKTLTPDRLRMLWELHNPDRPEVRSMLERLYRLPY